MSHSRARAGCDLCFDLHRRLFSADFVILQRSLYAYEMISQGRHQGVSLAIAIILIESALDDRTISLYLSLSLSYFVLLSLCHSSRSAEDKQKLIRNFFIRSERCLPCNYHRDSVVGSIYRWKCNVNAISENYLETSSSIIK